MMTHEDVARLAREGNPEQATKGALDLLNEDADDAGALFQLGSIMLEQNNPGIAYNLLARGCKLKPDIPEMWMMYSRAHPDKPEWWGRTEWCIRKAIKLAEKQSKKLPLAWANLAMMAYIKGDLDEADKHVDRALSLDSTFRSALISQGFIRLARGQWNKAWAAYDLLLKSKRRESYAYGDEPEWDGTHGKRIIISGEQGIGDEIMYASVFNDVIDASAAVVIECMPRLKGLFQRSFPAAKVYGTRWDKHVVWEEDHNPEAHVAMASIPRFFRHADSDFPGDPYLVANQDMRDAFAGMLAKLSRKPKVGIAWTGGTQRTRGYLRTKTLDELTPLLRQDVTWVSLEYNDRSEEIAEYRAKRNIDIHVFDWVTRKGLDYDLTAALVAELDLVITVPSTVSQTAGGLGIETWVMVPKYTGWIFARDVYPWANSVTPYRNTPVKDLAEKLESWISDRQSAAA